MNTTIRLRQICLVAEDLAAAEADICAIFGLTVSTRSAKVEEFGLDNFLTPIGCDFLEVISPKRDGTTAGRYLKHRGGDGAYMMLLQSNDAMSVRHHVTSSGIRKVWSIEYDGYVSTHFHPSDCSGSIMAVASFGEHGRENEMSDWPPALDQWREQVRRDVTEGMVGAEMQVDDPKTASARWAECLQSPLRALGPNQYALDFDHGRELRFVRPATDARKVWQA